MPSVHTGRLILTPADPRLAPEPQSLLAGLRDAGFLGPGLADRADGFLVGDAFLGLIIFAGCSVHLELAPQGDRPFCHITVAGPDPHPRLAMGRNTRPPRCPRCRAPQSDWTAWSAPWRAGEIAPLPCPTCGTTLPPWEFDWKESGGFGRWFLHVEEVFPGEAVPAPALFELLAAASGWPWRHFYVQDSGPNQPHSL